MTWKKTACILCSENCGLEVQTEGRRISKIRGDKSHPESRGYMCQKATRLDHYQNHSDRLTEPLARQADGSYKPISWDQAIAEIAGKLMSIKSEHGGDCIAYYGGGGQGNHLGGVYSSCLREALDTPFLYTALAQEKTGDFWVNGKLFGKQTCHLTADVENAELVVFLGTNPWQSHGFPRARIVLKEIQADPKRTMIVIDPRRTKTAAMADIHLQLRPGTDAYLLAAILAILITEERINQKFVNRHCTDQDEVLKSFKAIPIGAYIAMTGLDKELVHRAAIAIADAESASIRADLGIQQSKNSTLNSYLEKLLFLLTGNFGKPGGNTFHSFFVPLIGHSPDADEDSRSRKTPVSGMGPISKLYPPNILPEEILSDHPKHTRALIVDSSNPLVSGADTPAYRKAFAALDLLVVIDVAMTESAQQAHYILPASSQFEKAEATFFSLNFPDNSFHLRAPILSPIGDTLPEPEIYHRLCVAMGALPKRFPVLEKVAKYGGRRAFGIAFQLYLKKNPQLAAMAPLILYATLGKTLPKHLRGAAVLWGSSHIFAKRNPDALKRAGISGKRLGDALFDSLLREQSGFVFSRHLYSDTMSFVRHKDQRIHLAIPKLLEKLSQLPTHPEESDFPFLLMAGERRSYNANTIFRNPAWRKSDKEGCLQIHPTDAQKLAFSDGDKVLVESESGTIKAQILSSPDILPGVLSLPHGYGLHYPDDGERIATGPQVNELTSASHCDDISKTPFHKGVPVRLRAIAK